MQTDMNYEKDFYKWAISQAELLRSGKLVAADIENIAEEIESMGRSEKRELISRLEVLLMHLLKWKFQPSLQSKSRLFTIKEQRIRIINHLEDNPSLKGKLTEIMPKAYKLARIAAMRETGLEESIFPEMCPYSFEQAMFEEM
jgi:hypothetical protein